MDGRPLNTAGQSAVACTCDRSDFACVALIGSCRDKVIATMDRHGRCAFQDPQRVNEAVNSVSGQYSQSVARLHSRVWDLYILFRSKMSTNDVEVGAAGVKAGGSSKTSQNKVRRRLCGVLLTFEIGEPLLSRLKSLAKMKQS